eukprot:CAMPEP_0182425280 /NCGR_PEP_ID=MMETSP1167-20130531/11642_1 /TAXON_ID=2988 /ORGANISM="Mallomonas Sp, Strain CCMP3275" /LENGTH=733 /DNA_ID=CAMNT_0024605807 /DNA_START=65 /DNA_END=2266 /DNA_ORIENTATION=-
MSSARKVAPLQHDAVDIFTGHPGMVRLPEAWSSRVSPDESTNDLASKYDFCMVLNGGDCDGLDKFGKEAVTILTRTGLDLFIFKATERPGRKKHPDKKKFPAVFVLIRAPDEVLRVFSDKVDFPLLLDPIEVEKECKKGDELHHIAPFNIRYEPLESQVQPYQYIYGTYKYQSTDGVKESLYWRPAGDPSPFREIVRLKLTYMLVEERPEDGSTPIRILKDIIDKNIITFFPLHNMRVLPDLEKKMMNWTQLPWKEPLEYMKEYFGEKIGLYFKFMSHLNTWLLIPATLGLGAQIIVFYYNDFSHPILPVYAAVTLVWAILMQEFWKRREKYSAMRWGMIGFENNQKDRAEFRGKIEISYTDGQPHLYYPTKSTRNMSMCTTLVVLMIIFLVIAAVVGIYALRYLQILNQIAASVVNSAQIQIFNLIYSFVADRLTEMENHRTITAFEDSLIGKLFLFQFVNSYASFFYLAFIAEYLGTCEGPNCMSALALNLAIIFGVRIIASNATGMLIPYFQYRANIISQGLNWETVRQLPRPEQEELRASYSPVKDSIADNAEVVIQFGYMMLFVTALPLAATASAIFGYLQFKTDGYKLLRIFERPIPLGGEDIGTWQSIYAVLTIGAVICNAGLVVFTMVVLDDYGPYEKMWIFVGIILACYGIQYSLMEAIPDIPKEVEVQTARNQFIVTKIVEKVADDAKAVKTHVQEVNIKYQQYSDAVTRRASGVLDSVPPAF